MFPTTYCTCGPGHQCGSKPVTSCSQATRKLPPYRGRGAAARPSRPRTMHRASSIDHVMGRFMARPPFAKAKRVPSTDCLVMPGASGAVAQCGACSGLESRAVRVSRRHDTLRALARQQETLRVYQVARKTPPFTCVLTHARAG